MGREQVGNHGLIEGVDHMPRSKLPLEEQTQVVTCWPTWADDFLQARSDPTDTDEEAEWQ